jgi:predicted hydrolase (HD superfamily)
MDDMDYEKFKKDLEKFESWDDKIISIYNKTDAVNSPAHYTRGSTEAIDVIEDAIQDAPNPVEGMLQAQALKYLLRLWLKDNPAQDAKKAKWYLERLIDKLD